jgi:hypothetical protein
MGGGCLFRFWLLFCSWRFGQLRSCSFWQRPAGSTGGAGQGPCCCRAMQHKGKGAGQEAWAAAALGRPGARRRLAAGGSGLLGGATHGRGCGAGRPAGARAGGCSAGGAHGRGKSRRRKRRGKAGQARRARERRKDDAPGGGAAAGDVMQRSAGRCEQGDDGRAGKDVEVRAGYLGR